MKPPPPVGAALRSKQRQNQKATKYRFSVTTDYYMKDLKSLFSPLIPANPATLTETFDSSQVTVTSLSCDMLKLTLDSQELFVCGPAGVHFLVTLQNQRHDG